MKLSQLKKKYPKGFDKFINKMKLDYDYLESEDIRCYWKEITDFMDKELIIISIKGNSANCLMWFVTDFRRIIVYPDVETRRTKFFSRKQAETKAIEKAFEILENRLKEQK